MAANFGDVPILSGSVGLVGRKSGVWTWSGSWTADCDALQTLGWRHVGCDNGYIRKHGSLFGLCCGEKGILLLNPLNFQAASSFHSALLNFPVAGSGGVLATRRQELQDLSPEELAAARAAEVREKKAAAQFLSTWVWKKKWATIQNIILDWLWGLYILWYTTVPSLLAGLKLLPG